MANQDFCRVVSVILLTVCMHAGLVQGKFYSNNLKRYGTNVCEENTLRSWIDKVKTSYVGYTTYTTKCGLFGWSRCRRSRQKNVYFMKDVNRYETDTYLNCCGGWQRNGDVCTIPICNSGCNHGHCVDPDTCSCDSGWTGSSCSQDVNECSSNNGGCQQVCINRIGSSSCSCAYGYKMDTRDVKKCTDINECNLGNVCKCAKGTNENCGARCTNTVGSYRCSCGSGYRLVGSSVCADIDECATNKGGCLHQCVNSPGSFRCVCRRGFRMVDNKCQDVNECENSNGFCEQTCQNLIGRHRCKCKTGFALDRNRRTCSDIDECSVFHGCEDQCHNTLGGYFCACSKGYELSKNERTCTDVDECALEDIVGTNKTASLADCQQKCINNEGSFTCDCNNGFKLMYDKKRCQDVDECKSGSHQCEHACINTYGSYRCSCRVGYKLGADRRTCEGLPCEQIVSPHHGKMICLGLVTNSTCSFSCSPGYYMVGSQSRTCLATSRWSGNTTSCDAKQCKKLLPSIPGHSISVPCYTSFGSTCHFGCGPNLYLKGDGSANCTLSEAGDNSVEWKIGQFDCEEVQTCAPNPCRHGGNCTALDEKRFTCNCEGTGYKGDTCQTGFITTPTFTKLHPRKKSKVFRLVAQPEDRLKISLYSNKGLTFEPSTSLNITFPNTRQEFTVEAEKPGIRTISYTLEGSSKDDFDIPEKSVVFVSPEMSSSESLHIKLFLLKKELPIGCEERKTDLHDCELRLLSTAPWTGNPSSTSGIVHIATDNGNNIPLSLIGLRLQELQLSREKMTEASIAMTSSDKEFDVSYSNSGTCSTKKGKPDNLLELMEADTLASAFLQSLTKSSPGWLRLVMEDSSDVFDIRNVFVNVESSTLSDVEHCSGLPLKPKRSIAYFKPVINYEMFVGRDEVSLLADGKTCFVVDICKPAVFLRFPNDQTVKLRNTLSFLRHMKQRSFDLRVRSVGLLNDAETINTVQGVFWNGSDLTRSPSFRYNLWLKGDVEWKVEIPGKLKVTIQTTGESFVYYDGLDNLFHDRFTKPFKIHLKGNSLVTISGRTLGKDFVLPIKDSNFAGMGFLGGATNCSDSTPGISFAFGKSASRVIRNSPLAPYMQPVKDQQMYLTVFVQVHGGLQDQVANKRELRRTLTNLRYLGPEFEQILEDAKSFLPEKKTTLDKWIKLSSDFEKSIREIRRVLFLDRKIDFANLRRLISDIDKKIDDSGKIVELLKNRLESLPDQSAVADILLMIDDFQFGFPRSLTLQFAGQLVQVNFQGISFHFLARLCLETLCFDDINATVDYLVDNTCLPDLPPLSTFHVRGKASRMLSLSPGKILTISSGQSIIMTFDSNSDHVSASFDARLRLLGVSRDINVALEKTQLSFQTNGDIFRQFPTEMNVIAKVKPGQDWNSLVFSVNGKMLKSSLLPSLLENKIKESIHALAEKAARRVRKVQNTAHNAQRRTIEAKKQLQESKNKLLEASDELRTKQSLLNKHRSEYEQAKLQLNSTLMYYIMLKSQSVCELQNCSYVDTNACIPKICRKKMTVEYPVPDCSKVKKKITVDVIVQQVLTDWYWVPTFTSKVKGNCGSKNWFSKAFTGCDSYRVSVKGPSKKVSYKKYINFRESKKREIKVFKCNKPKYQKVFSGYDQPFECCDRDSGERVKILDPKCVTHNTKCFNNMTDFAENIRIENHTLFQDFQDMMHKGEIMTLAQLDVNKARAQVDFLSEQVELVQAFHKQQEYAEDSVNVTRVTSREELGLRLGEKMERLGVKRLVIVEGLSFSTTLTSTTKTLLPLVASLKTAEGGDSTVEFPMNFKNIEFSLNLASKRVIESLYGTSDSRKRRSTGQESPESIFDDPSLATNLRSCLFAKKANGFFTDIVQSLEFVVVTTKKLEKEMAASVHDFDKLSFEQDEAQGSGSNKGKTKPAASQQIRAAFGEMIQSLKEVQNSSSTRTSWNTTLEHWRGYIDVTTRAKNLTECSGSNDCVDYFFDTLRDLYEFEDNPRVVQIKQMLRRLEQTIDGLLDENTPLHILEETIANAKDLLNKTNDDVVLCGAAPVIVKSSPARITALEGGTVELTCEVMSAIEVQHLWKKNGQVIEDFTGSKLILRNATVHNEGAYTCEVSNKRGSVTSNVTMLIVHQKPNITENPRDLQVLLGSETASMVCNCSGTPRPSVEWFFIPMKSQTGQAVSLNFTEPLLTLYNLTFEDAGFYYCNATNLYQEVQSRIARLDVLGFTPGTTRVSLRLAIDLAQCATKSASNCSKITSSKSQQYDSGAFQFTLNEITRYMDWPSKRVEAFKYDPPPNTSISFVVNGHEPTIPEDGTSRYLKALDEFSKSQRSLAFDVKSLQSALQEGKLMYQWRNTKIQGRAGSLTMEVLTQKCSAGKEPQQNGFLCTDCTAGSYGLSNGTCLPCPVGYYQPDQGSAKCLRCSYETLTSKPAFIPWGRCIDFSTACKASEIPKVDNVTQPNKERRFYGSGEILVLKCQPGYKEKGNATLVCNRGNWTGDLQCERTCTPPWIELNKRCYKVIDVPTRRWKDAFGTCLRLKSHMAIIKSQEENDFVAKLAKSKIIGPAYTRMWLGLKRRNAKASFKWTDASTPTNYTNWIPGEPSNTNGWEFCTEMVITNSFWLDRWNDIKCDDRRFKAVSVCEKALKTK